MKVRIGLLGNSHLAAFRLGWDKIKNDYPQVEPLFFGATRGLMTKFRAQDGKLVPVAPNVRDAIKATSGGWTYIPGDLDAYVVVGLRFSFELLLRSLRDHRPPRLKTKSRQRLVSEEFMVTAMTDMVLSSQAVEVADMVRKVTSAAIRIVPGPYLSAEVFDDDAYAEWCNDVQLRSWAFWQFESAVATINERYPVVPQPSETIQDGMFTKASYRMGGLTLNDDARADVVMGRDFRHFNADFGALSLRELLDRHILPALK